VDLKTAVLSFLDIINDAGGEGPLGIPAVRGAASFDFVFLPESKVVRWVGAHFGRTWFDTNQRGEFFSGKLHHKFAMIDVTGGNPIRGVM
jgi:hypothetical protein